MNGCGYGCNCWWIILVLVCIYCCCNNGGLFGCGCNDGCGC